MANKYYTDDLAERTADLGGNAIINGNFEIWQRGETFTSIADWGVYTADRWEWFSWLSGAAQDVSLDAVADLPTEDGSGVVEELCMLIKCTTADASIISTDYAMMRQRIEGTVFKKFQGVYGTISFWVQSSKTGTYCVGLRPYNTAQSYVAEYTINQASTWEKKEITINFNYKDSTAYDQSYWKYDEQEGIQLDWMLTAGTSWQTAPDTWDGDGSPATANQVNFFETINNEFRLARVQFELGKIASPFKFRQPEQELALCQRYFLNIGTKATFPGHATTTTGLWATATFPVEMRVAPTFSYPAAIGSYRVIYAGSNAVLTSLSMSLSGTASALLVGGCAAILSQGDGCSIYNSSADAELFFDAEI